MKDADLSRLWLFDRNMREEASGPVCGVDEAGRGPLAGPVCAACVLLKPGADLPGLNDSKKLTERRREALFEEICGGSAAWYGVGWASPQEIDQFNILQATFLAMNRAYTAMMEQVPEDQTPVFALVDGNRDPGLPLPSRLIVKGDGNSAAIAAASVLAKVSRDRLMLELDREYPGYGFAGHKGYPTKAHYQAIGALGISPVHRHSFLRNLDSKL